MLLLLSPKETPLMSFKNLLYILLGCLGLSACKNTQSGSDKFKELGKEYQGEWYKRFSGTIADQPVVVNLHHYGDITVGAYYYAHKSVIIDLTESEDVTDKFTLHFNEFVRTSRASDDDNYRPDRWSINFSGNEINGKWTSGDGSKTCAIDLKEDYPAGTFALDVMVHADSATASKGTSSTTAVSSYELLQPKGQMKKDEADFFRATALYLVGGDTMGAKNLAEYIKKQDNKYFLNYKKLMRDVKIDKDAGEEWQYNFYHSRNMWVLYNDNNFLTVQLHEYDYSGGGSGHGNYWSTYANIDMQQKKVWQLNDIISVDEVTLLPILDRTIRAVFKMGPKDTLGNRLNGDAIHVTDNVYISAQGLTFCYNPSELATESDGEVCVFIPYTELRGMLKEDFRKRMGL